MINLLFPESQMFLFPGARLINSWERVYRNALRPYMSENLFILPWKWKLLSGFQLFVTPGLYSPWNSPGRNTGMGSCSLLQGILPTQGLNPDLPHCRRILYQLSHQGNPRILECVAYPFSSGSSLLRNQTGISCIAGRFFTSWAMREAPLLG